MAVIKLRRVFIMNKVEKFYDKITSKSMDYYVDDNTIWFNAEKIARGLGFVFEDKKSFCHLWQKIMKQLDGLVLIAIY